MPSALCGDERSLSEKVKTGGESDLNGGCCGMTMEVMDQSVGRDRSEGMNLG